MKWDQLNQIKVLCLGDLMLDTFVYGSVERISPEAPVPVFKHHRQFSVLGGAGNVVRNLVSLGAQVVCIGTVGVDTVGENISQHLGDLSGVTPILFSEKERKTPHKTRFIAHGQQVLRVDDESAAAIRETTAVAIIEAVAQHLHQCQVIILSDYIKGFLTPMLCKSLIALAGQHGIPVIVDPKGKDIEHYSGATLLTPNLKELKTVTHSSCNTQEEIIVAAQQLRTQANVPYVLVTRGADGMTLVTQQEIHHIPAEAREVYDVSGAGDTVIATLALAMATGESPLASARFANIAGGIVVGKAGTAVVAPEELAQHETKAPQKIHSLDNLQPLLAQWRRQQQRIGFTNGCFDLLHLGHLHILKQARQACDRLVIGLNTDASVKRLKGETRPVQSEQTRAGILAALEIVDAIVLFDEDTPFNLIQNILPDVLVKGADYRIDQVVGADVVQAHGGRVLLAELLPGNSTTLTVERINQAA